MSESISLHAWMFSISWFFQHVKFTSCIVGIRYFISEWMGQITLETANPG